MPPLPERSAGLALVMVLWVLALAAIVVTTQLAESRSSAAMARSAIDRLQLKAALEAAIYHQIGQRIGIVSAVNENGMLDGISVSVVAERQKTDLNTSLQTQLESALSAFVSTAEARTLSARILDWRDADDSTAPDGAEAAEYATASLGHRPRNGPFQHVTELGQVLGVSSAMLRRMRPAFTVYSGLKRAEEGRPVATSLGSTALEGAGEVLAVDATGQRNGQQLHAAATVMITGVAADPYRILGWEWTPVWH